MDSQLDFASRLGRIEAGERKTLTRAEMADPNSLNNVGKKKRAKLSDVAKPKPYWRYLIMQIVLISVIALFGFRVLAHIQGVDMTAHREALASGDYNDKLAAKIIGFSMIADPLYISK
jgi:hypothetical protein